MRAGATAPRSGPVLRAHPDRENITVKVKGFHKDAEGKEQAFEPQVTLEELDAFEKADQAAKSGTARARVRVDFAREILARTAPVDGVPWRRLQKAAWDIYVGALSIDDEEEDAAPLG